MKWEGFLYAPTDPDICKQVNQKGYYFSSNYEAARYCNDRHERDLARASIQI